MQRIYKIKNRKTGKFYLNGSSYNDAVGESYIHLPDAKYALKGLIDGKIKPARRYFLDPITRKGSMVSKPKSYKTVKSAFDYEIVGYDLVPSKTMVSWGDEFFMEVIGEALDPRDIVKLRKELEKERADCL